jgi:hypothetical protein
MAAKQERPQWLEVVQRFERAIGEPVEAFVRSDAYFDMMTQARRARARLTREFEAAAEEWLHRFNLPAATDIRRLREHLARVERQLIQVGKDVADLKEELEQSRGEPAAAKPKPPASRAAASAGPAGEPYPNKAGAE